MEQWTMEVLPDEIIVNILSRLPSTSVLQCKSVCKTWCSIISDPRFANMHLHRAIQTNPNMIYLSRSSTDRHELYSLEDNKVEFEEPIIRASRIINVPFVDYPFEVIYSYNGLLCLYPTDNRNHPIYIFNPTTEVHMKLPQLTIPTCVYANSMYGFGFNVSKQEFKVIQVLFYEEESSWSQGLESLVQVNTVGTSSSWRRIGNAPDPLSWPICPSTVFFNGSLHWMTVGPIQPDGLASIFSRISIVSFDMSVEEFGVVPKPEFEVAVRPWPQCFAAYYQLGVLGGCLSVTDCSSNDSIDVWVMKNYNVKGSWIKQFSIQGHSPYWCSYRLLMPVSLQVENLPLFKLGFRNRWIFKLVDIVLPWF